MTDHLDASDARTVERVVVVGVDGGLHARPAARLVEQARAHDCELRVRPIAGDEPVPADSMLAVTSLGVGAGERIRLLADGPEAYAVVQAVAATLTGGDPE